MKDLEVSDSGRKRACLIYRDHLPSCEVIAAGRLSRVTQLRVMNPKNESGDPFGPQGDITCCEGKARTGVALEPGSHSPHLPAPSRDCGLPCSSKCNGPQSHRSSAFPPEPASAAALGTALRKRSPPQARQPGSSLRFHPQH